MVTTILIKEYVEYQSLTANLLELQSTYESYLLLAKQGELAQFLDKDKQFLVVDRSSSNLKNIFKEDIVTKVRKKVKKKNVLKTTNRKAIFAWPISKNSFWISSFFGLRKLGRTVRMHTGIDLAALKGTPVYAAAGGRVIEACYKTGYGNTIVVEHNRKYKTRYAHLNEIFVKVGQNVRRGGKIGSVGDTGFVQSEGNNASHLHFEVYAFGKQVNPILFLPKH